MGNQRKETSPKMTLLSLSLLLYTHLRPCLKVKFQPFLHDCDLLDELTDEFIFKFQFFNRNDDEVSIFVLVVAQEVVMTDLDLVLLAAKIQACFS